MSSSPSPQGVLLHRLCPSCDLEILEDRTTCPDCNNKLIEVRDEIDTVVGTVIDDTAKLPGRATATIKVTADADKSVSIKLRALRKGGDEATPF